MELGELAELAEPRPGGHTDCCRNQRQQVAGFFVVGLGISVGFINGFSMGIQLDLWVLYGLYGFIGNLCGFYMGFLWV